MKCEEVRRLLTEEETDRIEEIQRHLAACDACRRLRDDLFGLKALSSQLKTQAKAPDFFASRVCSQIRPHGARLVALGLAGVGGVTVLLLFFGVFGVPGLPESQAPAARVAAPSGPHASPGFEPMRLTPAEDLAWTAGYQTDPFTVTAVVREDSSAQYVLEVPATIEVRQTQAENEFYLKNVSH
jgi:hypothetical protein